MHDLPNPARTFFVRYENRTTCRYVGTCRSFGTSNNLKLLKQFRLFCP
jgi:hypothetical protein